MQTNVHSKARNLPPMASQMSGWAETDWIRIQRICIHVHTYLSMYACLHVRIHIHIQISGWAETDWIQMQKPQIAGL